MTIAEFLTARLDEDEREANACLDQWSRGEGGSRRRWERVLAEVAAMRAIVAMYERAKADIYSSSAADMEDALGPIVRQFAAIWSSHPDYDPAWAAGG